MTKLYKSLQALEKYGPIPPKPIPILAWWWINLTFIWRYKWGPGPTYPQKIYGKGKRRCDVAAQRNG